MCSTVASVHFTMRMHAWLFALGELRTGAVNACLRPLCSMDGCSVVTPEGLGSKVRSACMRECVRVGKGWLQVSLGLWGRGHAVFACAVKGKLCEQKACVVLAPADPREPLHRCYCFVLDPPCPLRRVRPRATTPFRLRWGPTMAPSAGFAAPAGPCRFVNCESARNGQPPPLRPHPAWATPLMCVCSCATSPAGLLAAAGHCVANRRAGRQLI
jgi:hypothetical protein